MDSITLQRSQGRIPEHFLEYCGLRSWEILSEKLYDPDLSLLQVAELQNEIFAARTKGPIFLGGVFVSYSHEDSRFVDKLRDRLREDGASVWVDRHDATAGPLRISTREPMITIAMPNSAVMV